MGGYSSRNTFESVRKMYEFLNAHPQANFAVATGPGSGVFVVDIDGKEGVQSCRRLIAEHGEFPWPPSVKTPRGGLHFWFKYPSSEIGCSASGMAPKIDVRGDGGCALLPGSIGANGVRYRFLLGYGLDDVAIAPAPAWLVALASKPRQEPTSRSVAPTRRAERPRDVPSSYAAAALQSESAKVRSLPEGRRNDGLNRAAFRMGQLAGAGALDESAARAQLRTAALATGLPDSEVSATIESGISAGQRHPRVLEARRFEAPFRPARSTIDNSGGAGNRGAGEAGAIAEADLPRVAAGHSVLSSPGYDVSTRLYLALDPKLNMPAIPERPTKGDAERALRRLSDLLQSFPFVGDVDRAVALAFLLTPVVRGGISVARRCILRGPTPLEQARVTWSTSPRRSRRDGHAR